MSKRSRKQLAPQHRLVEVKTLVDIIIPVFGRFDLLQRCIDALPASANGILYKIILVDNCSPIKEEADKFYSQLDKNIIAIRNKKNLGFPRACNQGASKGKSPLIFLLNSDVILEPETLKNMVLAMDDPNVGVVGAKLIFPEGTQSGPENRIQHVGLATNIRGEWEHLFIGWKPDNPKALAVRDVLAVTGAALMTRRNLYAQLGGFDEIYGAGTYEDVDYCLKVRLLGKNVIIEQSAVGWHYTNASAREYGIGFPLLQNKSIFMARWMNQYPWTSWMYL